MVTNYRTRAHAMSHSADINDGVPAPRVPVSPRRARDVTTDEMGGEIQVKSRFTAERI